jgi:hypothetical protein
MVLDLLRRVLASVPHGVADGYLSLVGRCYVR